MIKVFIDGKEGATGLKLYGRLKGRPDVVLSQIPEAYRKDVSARKDYINESDVTFLCLPDDGAREAVSLIENERVKIIDASTAHRTENGWAYGFAELSEKHRAAIENSKRVANAGCHASGFIALAYPLIAAGELSEDELLSCFSLTGYSGGGKKMIAEYESGTRSAYLDAPRQYGLTQTHKHLKEMQKICGLKNPPVFSPVVGDFYAGMQVSLPLFKNAEKLREIYKEHYKHSKLISVCDGNEYGGFLPANAMAGRDDMRVFVFGNAERSVCVALFDNLGKGASGAAVQNMNVMFHLPEETGLEIGK
ncbi:MAG: N-acetyl-gamma-glutamyl-phosphate reductase [Bacillota bacterium]|nr:MAG: N-acetyl-gamma-glutamyl-phosphate reductase [Bacillota bacterium]